MATQLQYSCLENSLDRGAWWATILGVTKRGHTRMHTLFLGPVNWEEPDSLDVYSKDIIRNANKASCTKMKSKVYFIRAKKNLKSLILKDISIKLYPKCKIMLRFQSEMTERERQVMEVGGFANQELCFKSTLFKTPIRYSVTQSLSRVRLFATPWTAAFQAPLPMEFSRQEYWSGLPCPPPRDLPNPGIKPRSPTLQADSLLSEPPGEPKDIQQVPNYTNREHRTGDVNLCFMYIELYM